MINERVLKKMNEYIEEECVKTITVEELVDKLNKIKEDSLFTVENNSSFIKNISVNYTEGIEVNLNFSEENEADILSIIDASGDNADTLLFTDAIKQITHDSWNNLFSIRSIDGEELNIIYM